MAPVTATPHFPRNKTKAPTELMAATLTALPMITENAFWAERQKFFPCIAGKQGGNIKLCDGNMMWNGHIYDIV